jgi:hypothetical protein
MTTTLTPDLAKAVAAAKGQPVRLTDPESNQDYVLIKAEIFDRFRQLLSEDEEGLTMRQVGLLIHEAMREDDENDPLLESYQNYQRKG